MSKQKDLEGHTLSDYEELMIECNTLRRKHHRLTTEYENESLVILTQIDTLKKEMEKTIHIIR